MDKYTIETITNGSRGKAIAVVEWRNNRDLFLEISLNDVTHSTLDLDCFSAFQLLRQKFFHEVIFCCNGARRNFVQSGMMQQSGGFYGYLVKRGERSNPDETAFIFDYCSLEFVVSVEDQNIFKDEWFRSLS